MAGTATVSPKFLFNVLGDYANVGNGRMEFAEVLPFNVWTF